MFFNSFKFDSFYVLESPDQRDDFTWFNFKGLTKIEQTHVGTQVSVQIDPTLLIKWRHMIICFENVLGRN